jgi:hypothetical protein
MTVAMKVKRTVLRPVISFGAEFNSRGILG